MLLFLGLLLVSCGPEKAVLTSLRLPEQPTNTAAAAPVPATATEQAALGSPTQPTKADPEPAAPQPDPPTAALVSPTATSMATPPAPTPEATAYPSPPTPLPAVTPVAYPEPAEQSGTPRYSYRVVQTFPHDRRAYTQGLLVEDSAGILLESTGRYGESSLRRVALADGQVLAQYDLPETYFAEGIARVADRIIQLTWQAQTGFVYDRETLQLQGEFSYPHQGWGITYDGTSLIVSDGTDKLRFWDPQTLEETAVITVRDEAGSVALLNELEMVEGEVWANVYQTDQIARIDPATGQVLGWIDLTGLLALEERDGKEDVLNGIAYDPQTGRLFVTGKYWPLLFEIAITEQPR